MAYYNGKKVLSVASVEYLTPRGQIKLTENGSYDVSAYKKAVVSVFPSGTIQKIEDEGVAQGAGAFPTTILSKGLINYVGGMSQKVNQLVSGLVATKEVNGVTFTNNGDGSMTINGTATADIGSITSGEAITNNIVFKRNGHKCLIAFSRVVIDNFFMSVSGYNVYISAQRKDFIFTANESGNWTAPLRAYIPSGSTFNNVTIRPQVTDLTEIYGAGNEPTTTSDPRISQLIALLKKYPQYNEGSIVSAEVTDLLSTDGTNETDYPIPAEVQALDGYGMGIDDTLFNYIDFENKKFVKKVGSYTFSGNEQWAISGNGNYAYINFTQSGYKRPSSDNTKVNMLSEFATTETYNNIYYGTVSNAIGSSRWGELVISIDLYNDRANLVGKTIIFELATPTETDISEYLDRDFPNENLIDLYADGKFYFENENDMEVPYSLTYQERIN